MTKCAKGTRKNRKTRLCKRRARKRCPNKSRKDRKTGICKSMKLKHAKSSENPATLHDNINKYLDEMTKK